MFPAFRLQVLVPRTGALLGARMTAELFNAAHPPEKGVQKQGDRFWMQQYARLSPGIVGPVSEICMVAGLPGALNWPWVVSSLSTLVGKFHT